MMMDSDKKTSTRAPTTSRRPSKATKPTTRTTRDSNRSATAPRRSVRDGEPVERSTPTDGDDLNRRIAARVRELRARSGLSLAGLAETTGVSRSMLSLVERGESSPTAVVLEKIARGLGVVLPALFDPTTNERRVDDGPLSRRDDQREWRDPESGYVRRNVSPAGAPQPMRIVEVQFPPRARVAFENAGGRRVACQQIWLLDGEIDITVGATRHRLKKGDCLAMDLDQPTLFHNKSGKTARYAVVIADGPEERR